MDDNLLSGLIVAILVATAVALAGICSGLLGLRNRSRKAWSRLDVQLKRRHDLVRRLMAQVSVACGWENAAAVVQSRDLAVGVSESDATPQRSQAETELSRSLQGFVPALRDREIASEILDELSATETKIFFAKQVYNDCVARYNARLKAVPTYLIAKCLGFERGERFEIQDFSAGDPTGMPSGMMPMGPTEGGQEGEA